MRFRTNVPQFDNVPQFEEAQRIGHPELGLVAWVHRVRPVDHLGTAWLAEHPLRKIPSTKVQCPIWSLDEHTTPGPIY